jgi:hypothetical protein
MLENLSVVPWDELCDAYGPASEIPALRSAY